MTFAVPWIVSQRGGRNGASQPRGGGFVARVWLENDGERVDQPVGAARWPQVEAGVARIEVAGREIIHLTGKRAAERFGECRAGQIIVAAHAVAGVGPCQIFGPENLRDLGSLALIDGQIISAAARSGRRLWHPQMPRRAQ